MIGDEAALEDLNKWRTFIVDEGGPSLTIYA